MKKLIMVLMLGIALFSFSFSSVKALGEREVIDSSLMLLEEDKCNHMFGDPNKEGDFANYLQQIFNVFKYLAPALVIVLSIVEFIKAAASDDKEALLKASKKTV